MSNLSKIGSYEFFFEEFLDSLVLDNLLVKVAIVSVFHYDTKRIFLENK